MNIIGKFSSFYSDEIDFETIFRDCSTQKKRKKTLYALTEAIKKNGQAAEQKKGHEGLDLML